MTSSIPTSWGGSPRVGRVAVLNLRIFQDGRDFVGARNWLVDQFFSLETAQGEGEYIGIGHEETVPHSLTCAKNTSVEYKGPCQKSSEATRARITPKLHSSQLHPPNIYRHGSGTNSHEWATAQQECRLSNSC